MHKANGVFRQGLVVVCLKGTFVSPLFTVSLTDLAETILYIPSPYHEMSSGYVALTRSFSLPHARHTRGQHTVITRGTSNHPSRPRYLRRSRGRQVVVSWPPGHTHKHTNIPLVSTYTTNCNYIRQSSRYNLLC